MRAPQCTVGAKDGAPLLVAATLPRPYSWPEVRGSPTNSEEDCYNASKRVRGNGLSCCCAFWPTPVSHPADTCAAAFVPSTHAHVRGCSQLQGPRMLHFAHRGPQGRTCGRYAVALSGEVRNLHVGFASLRSLVLAHGVDSVDLFAHLAAPSLYFSTLNGTMNSDHLAARKALFDLLDLPNAVAAVVEAAEDIEAVTAVRSCVMRDAGDAFVGELLRRHQGNGPPRETSEQSLKGKALSAFSMYRLIYLAHTLVVQSRCSYAAVLRARPDMTWLTTLKWADIAAQLASTRSIQIVEEGFGSLKFGHTAQRRRNVPFPLQCFVDDQVSIGTMAGMGDYASLFVDFAAPGMATSILIHRRDTW
eukprot:CAMPEP_0119338342 /NCGR_PEP_ID=MMETSP1333-20130426/95797_1 /TAXON_ID=418940 /ORGANISM="Scyphosphaera apsteinii, Strain RCC1455" /LENGTH=360 /DNA_ID=CAMNT_0007349583 /DNA_START=69 /DNA_END=1148 /DNA_ORIENTATION=-